MMYVRYMMVGSVIASQPNRQFLRLRAAVSKHETTGKITRYLLPGYKNKWITSTPHNPVIDTSVSITDQVLKVSVMDS